MSYSTRVYTELVPPALGHHGTALILFFPVVQSVLFRNHNLKERMKRTRNNGVCRAELHIWSGKTAAFHEYFNVNVSVADFFREQVKWNIKRYKYHRAK